MGAIIARLRSTSNPSDIFIDFESHNPPSHDKLAQLDIYNNVQLVLDDKDMILQKLVNYKPCTEQIRESITHPSPQSELLTFNALLPAVSLINELVVYSSKISTITSELLHILSVEKSDTVQSFNDQQSLAYQLCDILNFILQFDSIRISIPQLNNDFSYYRRIIHKFSSDPRIVITDDMTNNISQWCTLTCPMLSSVSKSASHTLQSNPYVPIALSTIAVTCRQLIELNKFTQYSTNLFCVRSMVSSIVLYDHIDIRGAFYKNNPCDTKLAVKLINDKFSKENGLLDAIQYCTIHFKEASPKLQALFQK